MRTPRTSDESGRRVGAILSAVEASAFDGLAVLSIFAAGALYLWDTRYWAIGLVGDHLYGDAEFWWNGALHVAEGIFRDNPGQGFRPGYFLFTGATIAVLGPSFVLFHKYLLFLFLTACSAFYLVLRHFVGSVAAASAVLMMVLNPYTAEWLATTTTDGLGLIFNLLALCSLLTAVRRGWAAHWVAAFGLMSAAATLTRPVVTLFVGLVFLIVLLHPARALKARVFTASILITSFLLPTLLWMGVQRGMIGEWTLSTNDASPFYAASDPAIQVWNPTMYAAVAASAARRLGTTPVSTAHVNEEFWRLTRRNYQVHWRYHLNRLVPHALAVARFSPMRATHPSRATESTLLVALSLALLAVVAFQGRWVRALAAAVCATAFWIYPAAPVYAALVGTATLLLWPRRWAQPGMSLIAVYWLVGIAALFQTGGTWGPPLGTTYDLNALGYRLGLQSFFARDVIVVWLVASVVLGFHHETGWQSAESRLRSDIRTHRGWTSRSVAAIWIVASCVVVGVLLAGSTVIVARTLERSHSTPTPFPDPQAALRRLSADFNGRHVLTPPLTDYTQVALALSPKPSSHADSGSVVATGAPSSFVWNLPGQRRAQLLWYPQNVSRPFMMGRSGLILEIPEHLSSEEWAKKQGVFVLRRFDDSQNTSNLPYYLTAPAITAFVPLSRDGRSYDIGATQRFSMVKYASQLDAARELTCRAGRLEWRADSGTAPSQRRVFLHADATGIAELVVDVSHGVGARVLRFTYNWESVPVTVPDHDTLSLTVVSRYADGREAASSAWPETVREARDRRTLRPVSIDLADRDVGTVEIILKGVPGSGFAAIYELNFEADDFTY